MEFKGTKGDFKDDIWIDLLGNNDELMRIIISSNQVNSHNVAHVFGLSQEEVIANSKLFANSKKMLEMLKIILSETDPHGNSKRWNEIQQLIKEATEL